MAAVSLAEAKAHLRIDFDDDDGLVTGLIGAAETYVSKIGVATAAPVPAPVQHAIKLLLAHWYDNREAAQTEPPRAIAFGVNALLAPYREYSL